MSDNKRKAREEKRIIKKHGTRKLRHLLKEELRENPEDALTDDTAFKLDSHISSKNLNNFDKK
jgi:hypothetical protein